MPNTREKLIELMCSFQNEYNSVVPDREGIADHLIANGVTVQKWIPVTEDRPREPGEYIVKIVGAGRATSLWYNPVEDVWFNDDYRDTYPVSHWMPLPGLPKEDTE